MQPANTIPEHVTPAQFFETILPDWAEDIFSPPPFLEEVCLTTQVAFQDGDTWSLTFDLGDYSFEQGPSPNAFFYIQSSLANWDRTLGKWTREIAQDLEKAGGPEEYIEQWLERETQSGRPIIKLTDAKIEALRGHPTVLEGRVDDYQGSSLSIRIGIATSDLQRTPDFTIKTDGDTYEQLRTQTIHPLDAWKQKRIQIEGKLAHAIQLGNLFQKNL